MRWCARERQVAYFEPPRFDASTPALELTRDDTGVLVAVPHLVPNTAQADSMAALRRMVDRVRGELGESPPVLWYATPMAVDSGGHLDPAAVVYDCSWELETFVAASLEARARERWLLTQADLVFTDCHSLYQHKRRTTRHPNIHPLLASVDFDHVVAAREQPPSCRRADDHGQGPEIWAQTWTQVRRAIEGRGGPLSVGPSRTAPSVDARSDRTAVTAESTTIAAQSTSIVDRDVER